MKKEFFVVAAVFFSSQLTAQDPKTDSAATSLDEVVLTASKHDRKQSETGKVLSVINREQLDRMGGKTLPDLLNTVAGTTIIGTNNSPGTNLTASIRGSSAGNVLILLDGIPVNDPSVITNYADLNFIDPDQVERIEILKGGQSTLYGSDAVAGVINIITRKTATGKTGIVAKLTAGSYNAFEQMAGISKQDNKAGYSLYYSHLSTDGFSAAHDPAGTGDNDKDGLKQHTVNGRFNIRLTAKLKAVLSGSFSRYKADLDASPFTDEKDYTATNKNIQAGAGLVYQSGIGIIRLNYSFNRTERYYLDDSVYKSSPFTDYQESRFTGRTHYAEIYGNWRLKHWELLAGADYRGNHTDQSSLFTGPFGPFNTALDAKMNQVSPYLSATYNRNGFTLEAGGRINIHSEYGTNATYTVNPSYLLKKKVKMFINLYSAFKTPTLYQLFDAEAGNAELLPERSHVAEAGVQVTPYPFFSGRVTGFYRKTEDVVLYTYNPSTFRSLYINGGRQTNYGVELETSYKKDKLDIMANYTYTDGKTTSGFDGTGTPIGKDTTYFNLYRVPKHAINFSAGYQVARQMYSRVQVRSVSRREEFIYGTVPAVLDGYATVDLYTEYSFKKKLKVFLDLRNLTNTEYFDFLGYNTRKFNFTTGVSVQF